MKKIIPDDAVLVPDNAKHVFQGEIYSVWQWPQPMYDGTTATFEMLKRPDTTQAICIVDGKILVLSDEQPHRGVKLTFPGGRADHAKETVEHAAQREVREETGYEFSHWKLVEVKQVLTKIEWFIYTFVAWSVQSTGQPMLDGGEIITQRQLPLVELKRLIAERSGYLGEASGLFERIDNVADLQSLPEFRGKLVDRP